MNLYTADLHFGHSNVINFDHRPFIDVDEMDRTLIALWNNRVRNDDDVWILGDLIYRSSKDATWYLRQLKGKKHLIIGNHEKAIMKNQRALKYFESVEMMQEIVDHINNNPVRVIMCHYPIAEWNGFYRNAYHVYGHIHNNKNEAYQFLSKYDTALNAGCMINNYAPASLRELIENNKKFKNSWLTAISG